jgi:hypothetical protein
MGGGGKSAPQPSHLCPHCRKPLPRCSICGHYVGCDAGSRLPPPVDPKSQPKERHNELKPPTDSSKVDDQGGEKEKNRKSGSLPQNQSAARATPAPPPSGASALTPFDHFPAWCQVCRHGGHAGHLNDWFDLYVSTVTCTSFI